jgi:hypothetical protein
LSSVTFDWGSKLSRIEPVAFRDCSSLSSIYIRSPIADFPGQVFDGRRQISITQIEADSINGSAEVERQNDSNCHLGHIGEDQ